MKKKIGFMIVILIGLIDLGYGIYNLYAKYQFKENSVVTRANIYGISNDQKNGKKVLYVDFYVDGNKYDGVIVTDKEEFAKKDSITIYYNPKDPKVFTDGTIPKTPWLLIGLGFIITLFSTTLLFIKG